MKKMICNLHLELSKTKEKNAILNFSTTTKTTKNQLYRKSHTFTHSDMKQKEEKKIQILKN